MAQLMGNYPLSVIVRFHDIEPFVTGVGHLASERATASSARPHFGPTQESAMPAARVLRLFADVVSVTLRFAATKGSAITAIKRPCRVAPLDIWRHIGVYTQTEPRHERW